MFVVVSYDIPEDRRRTKVMKLLRNFGAHVQYSVFECELKDAAYQQLRERLAKLVSPQVDSVRFYFLDEDQVKRIEVVGKKPVERPKEFYVVG
jgi:CRISPR-associated protein Cas2